VDARRLRGRADPADRLHVGATKTAALVRHAAGARDGVPADADLWTRRIAVLRISLAVGNLAALVQKA
jgi:hypothetical protein